MSLPSRAQRATVETSTPARWATSRVVMSTKDWDMSHVMARHRLGSQAFCAVPRISTWVWKTKHAPVAQALVHVHTQGMTTALIPKWTLGDRLAKARKDVAHLSVRDMADRLGVTKNTVSNWENEVTTPRRYAVEAWATITGVDAARRPLRPRPTKDRGNGDVGRVG